MACIRCCLVTGSRDSLPVCARTRSYSYAFPYCARVSHAYFPSAHRGQRRYHVKSYGNTAWQTNHSLYQKQLYSSKIETAVLTEAWVSSNAIYYCHVLVLLVIITNFWLLRNFYIYTGCPRRNGQNFGRVFVMLKYTDITQNTYVQSWAITEIMAREKCGLLWGSTHCTCQLSLIGVESSECGVTLRQLSKR
jgi:hypothetical protein